MSAITVFTPTYNRAHTIGRTYESLCRQSCRDFEWLVVDDGSTDGTSELVKGWIAEKRIPLRYIHKENGGLHTGYNVAIRNIDSLLCICCDSDDFLPDDCIKSVLSLWHEHGSDKLAGIIGLDCDASTHEPIGGMFSQDFSYCHFVEIPEKLGRNADTKMVLRTDLLKPLVPMPSFPGEKNFNPIYLYLRVDPELDYLVVNRNFCFVDYQPDGMSAGIFRQFRNSPHSFAEIRKVSMVHPRISFKNKFKAGAHLVSSALLARDLHIATSTPRPWLTLAATPLGVALYLFILYKTRK